MDGSSSRQSPHTRGGDDSSTFVGGDIVDNAMLERYPNRLNPGVFWMSAVALCR
ncbi:MAG: hypothetical protein ACRC20_02565 [Segniliparus sp.]|uniref:hypothetical protein n=1 Tax=Segniliparus sp. TaxID=2804064 RepID=UPI003F3917AA